MNAADSQVLRRYVLRTDSAGSTPAEEPAPARRVLFVDDEVKVLEALKRLLRTDRHRFSMSFASDPREALEMMREQPFDALVTDMRMPQMDGAELLAQVRELCPGVARIVLSGYSEREVAVRAVGLAHQFLAKPCDAITLRKTIARACRVRELLADAGLAEAVCRLGALPSLPRLYEAVAEEMSRPDISLARLAGIIEQDLAMTAKVLQLVNSDFFGSSRTVSTMHEAVAHLGVDVIRALVLSNVAFSAFETAETEFFEELWQHSAMTGVLASRIAAAEQLDTDAQGEALQAGMLHDIGQLILAGRWPEEHQRIRTLAAARQRTVLDGERDVLGCDHARVGAYLMGLWGLSDSIVDALAFHHRPAQHAARCINTVTVVHAADALVHERLGFVGIGGQLDVSYIHAVGGEPRLSIWREEAERLLGMQDRAEP